MANATDVLIRLILSASITEPQFVVFLSHLWSVLRQISRDRRSYQCCPRATLRGSAGDLSHGQVMDVVWSFKHGPLRGIAWVVAHINARLIQSKEHFIVLAAASIGDCDSYGGLNYGIAQQLPLCNDLPFYASQRAGNDSMEGKEDIDSDEDACQSEKNKSSADSDENVLWSEPNIASDAGIQGDVDQWWLVQHHRASLSPLVEPMRSEIENVITASSDIDVDVGACDYEYQRKYVAKMKELQIEEVDIFAHLTEPAHVQCMDFILPGWQHSTCFLANLYLMALLQAGPPPLGILRERIATYLFPQSIPLFVVAERLWHWGSDATETALVPSLRLWDIDAQAAAKKMAIFRKRTCLASRS